MKEIPFSPEIQQFNKPLEIGDTNQIYYDPQNPDILIRIPVDKEARFLAVDTRLIKIAEKYYQQLEILGKD